MELGKDFRKVFYLFGGIIMVLAVLILWRTLFKVVPAVGLSRSITFLVIGLFFLVLGVAMVLYARRDQKKEAAKAAAEKTE